MRSSGRKEIAHTKERAHQTKHIREEGDDLRDNEGYNPCGGEDEDPDCPCDYGVGVEVPGFFENPEEDETRGHRL